MIIKVEEIEIKKRQKIGVGGNGQVYLGETTDGSFVAIKEQMKISDHEYKILQALKGKKCEHIIQVYAFEEQKNGIFTIMELAESFDIKNMSDKNGICLQMAKGVSELHQLGFFHRDLKPDNFVIGKDDKIKLIDFGTTKQIREEIHTNSTGTYIYMAPEMIITNAYDSSIDIWSLGVIFYEVITNETFFAKYDTDYLTYRAITQISQQQINNKIRKKIVNQQLNTLLQKMIVQYLDGEEKIIQQKKRIGIDEVINELEKQKYFEQHLQQMEDLYEILASFKPIDRRTFNMIFEALMDIQHKENLINQISKDDRIIQFLKSIVSLTALNNKFIELGSKSLNLLVEIKVDLTNQNLEKIKIKNTSLIGANFVRCNLSGSEFDNVDISGMNLNEAQLFNCRWKNIKIDEQHKLDGHSGYVSSVCFSPDGTKLASGSWDNTIRLQDVKTGKQKVKFHGNTSYVLSVCFSPDGSTLASGGTNNSINFWDVQTGNQKAQLNGHNGLVYSVCFSPDGQTLASGSGDNLIWLWDVKTGQQKKLLNGHSKDVLSVCFSPNGTKLASGSKDYSIMLWDVKESVFKYWVFILIFLCCFIWAFIYSYFIIFMLFVVFFIWLNKQMKKSILQGHSGNVNSVCFSPDGTILASCSDDKSIRLWNIQTGQQNALLNGHSDYVRSVCFSPDGQTLASGSDDNSIRLWDVRTGKQKAEINGHSDYVRSVCFSPDGSSLASCSDDNSIRLWDVRLSNSISSNINLLLISQQPIFQAQGAQIHKGQFENNQGVDLFSFLQSKGSLISEDEIQNQN
ncbi:unnamed protein product [Paramecium primaurelia]|uniref:Protein kinase domain-containing protein n=1 Tax=Paramecium primaurelia TaxID=5886 RepID=A0A8S1KML4_PARPR|nr:unnamed protein product [Paramecium primaurelia]